MTTLHDTRRVLIAARQLDRPSVREIATATGLSVATVWYHLLRLRDDYGWVSWQPGKARTIRVTETWEG